MATPQSGVAGPNTVIVTVKYDAGGQNLTVTQHPNQFFKGDTLLFKLGNSKTGETVEITFNDPHASRYVSLPHFTIRHGKDVQVHVNERPQDTMTFACTFHEEGGVRGQLEYPNNGGGITPRP
jgi:hypothetical protein